MPPVPTVAVPLVGAGTVSVLIPVRASSPVPDGGAMVTPTLGVKPAHEIWMVLPEVPAANLERSTVAVTAAKDETVIELINKVRTNKKDKLEGLIFFLITVSAVVILFSPSF
jgi:hypothetical protein